MKLKPTLISCHCDMKSTNQFIITFVKYIEGKFNKGDVYAIAIIGLPLEGS